MKKSILILVASVSLAALGACDSGAENAQEQKADAVRDNTEVQADIMEVEADAMEDNADAQDKK